MNQNIPPSPHIVESSPKFQYPAKFSTRRSLLSTIILSALMLLYPLIAQAEGILLSQSLPPLQGQGGGASTLQGYVSSAPVGTAMSATLSSPLSSEFAHPGDRFMATLGSDVAAGGNVILPAGSQLEGEVVSVEKAGRTGKNGSLDVRFISATLPSGQRVPLSAKIKTEDTTGVLHGGTTVGRVGGAALKTGLGAGLGAALGTAMGPLSGGHVGRGAIYGTAIGSGLGLATGLWQKGQEATLSSGKPVNVVLDQPLSLNSQYTNQYSQPQYQQPYNQSQSGYNNSYNNNNGNSSGYYGQ